jgi:hypothetical protein
MCYVIITIEGEPLTDHDRLGVIVFETEASAATFLMPRERIEWWPDDRLAQWSEMDRQTGPS